MYALHSGSTELSSRIPRDTGRYPIVLEVPNRTSPYVTVFVERPLLDRDLIERSLIR